MKKFLITGASGFIGRSLKKYLEDQGHSVVAPLRANGQDLTNQSVVQQLPDVDIVIHLAGINNPAKFATQPYLVTRNNLVSTQYLLDRYINCVDRFVLASTSESQSGSIDYFNVTLPINETIPVSIADINDPRSCYGGSKLANELQVISAHHEHKLPYTIIRYHNIYGPGQTNQFITDFIKRAKSGDVKLMGGASTRNFLYIDDAINATYKILQSVDCQNQIINLGSDQVYSITQIAQIILEQLKINKQLELDPGSPKYRHGDMTKLHKLINFTPTVDIIEGIKRTINA